MKFLKYGCLLVSLAFVPHVSAKTVHSFDQIPSQIHSQEGKKYFAENMMGDTSEDGLGTSIWSGQTALDPHVLMRIVDPEESADQWGMIGVKPWPSQKDRYVLVACLVRTGDLVGTGDYVSAKQEGCLQAENHHIDKILVAVFTYKGSGRPQLVDSPYIENLVERDDQGIITNKDDDAILTSAFTLKNNNGNIAIGDLQRLDFARYRISNTQLAFGIRFKASVGYAGGDAMNQSMTLFALIHGQLRPILKVPTYHYTNIAGDWHKDGTRDHDIKESNYTLTMLPTQTHGFYDIKYSETGSEKKNTRIFHWNDKISSYQ